MKIKRLDGVVIMVKDMDKGMEFFSKKLGIEFMEFHGPPDPKEMGVRLGANFDYQLELMSPIEPLPEDAPAFLKRWVKLLEHREGVPFSLSFRVDDAEQVAKELEQKGIRVEEKIDSPEIKELSLRNLKERRMKEEDTMGIPMTFTSYEIV